MRLYTLAAALLFLGTGCGQKDALGSLKQPITHDGTQFGPHLPAHVAIMFSMSWFGIPASDKQGVAAGEPAANYDVGYRNWDAYAACASQAIDNNVCNPCIRWAWDSSAGAPTCVASGSAQRMLASRRRPLAGIYSSAGITEESKRRVRLMLSMLRRPGCGEDDGHARLDVWAPQNVSVQRTTRHCTKGTGCYSDAADLPYQAMMSMFREADAAGMTGTVMPGYDASWLANFNYDGCSTSMDHDTPPQSCLDSYQADFHDLAAEAVHHPSAFRVNGQPVLLVWGLDFLAPAVWRKLFDGARGTAGTDFYVIGFRGDAGYSSGGVTDSYFTAFDAIAPWTGLGSFPSPTGDLDADSYAYAKNKHATLLSQVKSYPGRAVGGGVTTGFDDWTRNWNKNCQERRLPPGSYTPRDPKLLTEQFNFLLDCKSGAKCTGAGPGYDFRILVAETWDDWTEGHHFEPDVAGGPDELVRLRRGLGKLFDGLPRSAADDSSNWDTGDLALSDKWTSYGQARNCDAALKTPPDTSLTCSPASTGTLRGTVTDISSGQPLSQASVSCASGSATTDATGAYLISSAATGTYDVTAKESGYITRVLSATVAAAQTTILDFQLATGGNVKGAVTDHATGKPIAAASVSFSGGVVPTTKSVPADPTGAFYSDWIPIGTYQMTCSAAGYQDDVIDGVLVTTGQTTHQDCSLTVNPVASDAAVVPADSGARRDASAPDVGRPDASVQEDASAGAADGGASDAASSADARAAGGDVSQASAGCGCSGAGGGPWACLGSLMILGLRKRRR